MQLAPNPLEALEDLGLTESPIFLKSFIPLGLRVCFKAVKTEPTKLLGGEMSKVCALPTQRDKRV